MKRLFGLLVLLPVLGILAMTNSRPSQEEIAGDKLKWYTWEEAVELNKKNPRKLFIDMYTDWCGWCKVMDKETFSNDTIADYLSKNFYCIKFNAERRDSMNFSGHGFKWISPEKGGGRYGIHELAYALLDGNLSYPTIVYMNEKYERIAISPGYKIPSQLMPELRFAAEEIYKTKSYQDFIKGNTP